MKRSLYVRYTGKGDTIIEVMIAVAVLGVVLVGAYTMAGRSLAATQDAQEHAVAIKLVEGQLERLNQLVADRNSAVFNAAQPYYCIDPTDNVSPFAASFSLPTIDNDQFLSYPSACRNINTFYNLSIQYQPSVGAAMDVFTVRARWDSLNVGKNEVSITYKLHPLP